MKNKNRLRLSYSLLLLWSQGRVSEAVDLYLHKDTKRSKAMDDGLLLHKEWATKINRDKKLTLDSTTLEFKSPITELERTIEYNDRYDLKGVFDCLDGDILYEFKSGVLSSLEYAVGYQIPIYFLIGNRLNMGIEQARIIHYNQHKNKCDISLVWNTSSMLEKADNFISSLAPDIEKYFLEIGILEK